MTIDTSPRSPASRLTLLVWMLVLVAVAVGAVVALAELDDAAGLVLACVALLA